MRYLNPNHYIYDNDREFNGEAFTDASEYQVDTVIIQEGMPDAYFSLKLLSA